LTHAEAADLVRALIKLGMSATQKIITAPKAQMTNILVRFVMRE
jgi:hypothetical protein